MNRISIFEGRKNCFYVNVYVIFSGVFYLLFWSKVNALAYCYDFYILTYWEKKLMSILKIIWHICICLLIATLFKLYFFSLRSKNKRKKMFRRRRHIAYVCNTQRRKNLYNSQKWLGKTPKGKWHRCSGWHRKNSLL